MKKYHVNSEGNTLECKATIQTCPMGHHAPTKEEAAELYQQEMKQKQFKTIKKQTNKTEKSINSFTSALENSANKKTIAEKYIQFSQAINEESILTAIKENSFNQYEINNIHYEMFKNLAKDPEFIQRYNEHLNGQLQTVLDETEYFDQVSDIQLEKISPWSQKITITLDKVPHQLTIETSGEDTVIFTSGGTTFVTRLSRGKADTNENAKQRILDALTDKKTFQQVIYDIDRPTNELLAEEGKQKYSEIKMLKKVEQIVYNARNLKEKDNIPLETPYEEFAEQRKLKTQVISPNYQEQTDHKNFLSDIAHNNGGMKTSYFHEIKENFIPTVEKIEQLLAAKERETYKNQMKPISNKERNTETRKIGFRHVGENAKVRKPESSNYEYVSYDKEIKQFLAGDKNILLQSGATARIVAARDGDWAKRYTEKDTYRLANSFLIGDHNNPNAKNNMARIEYEDLKGIMDWSKQCLEGKSDTLNEYRNLYRGGIADTKTIDAIEVGTVIQSETPISTSAEEKIAERFTTGEGHDGVKLGEGKVGYRMNIISKRGKDMRPHAMYVYENEYLLPMGIQLTCAEKTIIDGVPTFTMIETS